MLSCRALSSLTRHVSIGDDEKRFVEPYRTRDRKGRCPKNPNERFGYRHVPHESHLSYEQNKLPIMVFVFDERQSAPAPRAKSAKAQTSVIVMCFKGSPPRNIMHFCMQKSI